MKCSKCKADSEELTYFNNTYADNNICQKGREYKLKDRNGYCNLCIDIVDSCYNAGKKFERVLDKPE